ncbi:MAG: hypothetical protein KAI43_14020 [Candidatus Aureabacteria bacterium]|nr:hypothetical protein [Candidatus Auribacterota bacterium]
MINFTKNHKKLIFPSIVLLSILCSVVVFILKPDKPQKSGVVDANKDILKGHFEIKTYGKPIISREKDLYYDIIKKKYNVNFKKVADCVLLKSEMVYYKEYNETLKIFF